MTSDQPSPGTSGHPSPGLDGLLPPGSVVTVTGPWTVRSCVTAACTRCGAVPLDEDTSTTPHFADTGQAAQELAQNWGWQHQRGTWPKDDVLLCPPCAAQALDVIPLAANQRPRQHTQEESPLKEGERTMAEGYIAPEISDWLDRLKTALPPDVAQQDGTRMDRAPLIEEIKESFAHLMSTGPDYSRTVTDHVQDAVRSFHRGNGDQAAAAIRRAHEALPGHTARPAPATGVNDV